MAPEAQLEWEARAGRLAAGAAFLSALFSVGSAVLQATLIGSPADDEAEALERIDEHSGDFLLTLGTQALAYAFLAGALFYLLRAAMARRPEIPKPFAWLLVLGPLLLTVGGLLTQLDLADIAERFTDSGERSVARAEDLLEDRDIASSAIASGGTLCLALSFVLVSLNAMRVGLLSRFMGILGIIAGGLLVLPLLPGGGNFIQLFWMVALGMLFLDRWPGGRGPAWETVEAIPWPSAAERRDDLAASGDEHPLEPDPVQEPAADDAAEAHPVSKKRKRKRRR